MQLTKSAKTEIHDSIMKQNHFSLINLYNLPHTTSRRYDDVKKKKRFAEGAEQ